MAIRNIREEGDELLRKISRPVTEMTERIDTLIDDMLETMYEAEGVGLAAPQVGILRRIFVVDIGEGPIVMINPEIIETSGEQEGPEGCLSVPGFQGTVIRPNYVKMKGLNRKMKPFTIEAEEFLARALCHEFDHLNGILYIDKVEGEVYRVSEADEEDYEEFTEE